MRLPTSRRGILAAAALAATLALTACGSATDQANDKTDAGAGPAKIRVAAGGGAAGLTAAGSERAAADGDSKIAGGMVPSIGMAPTEWIVEGTLPELDGEAKAWVYPAKPSVSTEDIAAIAKALGLEGDVVAVPEDQGGGWLVGSADYTGPRLSVDRTGMASWYYDSAAYARVRSACVAASTEPVPVAPDATVSPDPSTGSDGGSAGTEPAAPAVECPEPTPPANVPSADEARTKTLALAKALGQSPAAADLRVEGDEWGRYVTWSSSLDGVASPAMWSAVYGAEGELVSASGTLVEPKEAVPYPRIGTTKALELLKSGQGWFGAWPAVTVAGDGSATATVGIAAEPAVTEPAASDPAVSGPAAEPPMEPYKVTITGVEAALTTLYGVEGDVWLVPAYRFVNADGEVALVPAIDSSYVEEAAPVGDPGIGVGGVSVGSSGSGAADSPAVAPAIAPTAIPAVEVTAAKP